jgi:hypothetical protein
MYVYYMYVFDVYICMFRCYVYVCICNMYVCDISVTGHVHDDGATSGVTICMYIHFLCIYTYIYMYTYMYVCMYVCICAYMYMHTMCA